ncbi:MAG: hypothetical protein ABW000_03985 [Actinoplanes sp.]
MLTVGVSRRLLVVVRTVTTLSRLLDVLSLTAGDRRIQTVFTHDTQRRSTLAAGVEEALADLGALILPWEEATGSRFDLALAASENDRLADLDAPVLLLPHGAGYQKFYPNTSVVSGLNADRLVVDGRVVPAAIALPHPSHLARLRQSCPEAAPYGVVVGDPALARMRSSQFRTPYLRSAIGGRDKHVVVLASTYGPESVLGRLPDLPEILVANLPGDEYQVVVVLHPGVWAAHGPWQVRAWLSQAVAYGVRVVPPQEGWQAALLAASVVISDHGSLALYAAVLGKPVLLAGRGSSVTVPGSAAAVLAATVPGWDPAADPREQLDAAIRGYDPTVQEQVTDRLVDPEARAGDPAHQLRALIYRLLNLAEPPAPAAFAPVPAPPPQACAVPAWAVGAEVRPDGIRIERYPDLGTGRPHDGLSHRHLVSDERSASLTQLGSAAVVVTDFRGAGLARRWIDQAPARLRPWPQATMLAAVVDQRSCLLWTDAGAYRLTADDPIDPVLLASLAYVRLTTTGRLLPQDRLYLADRSIAVEAAAG